MAKKLEFGFSAAIAINNQLSAAVDMNGFVLCGVLVPTPFTGVAMTFQVSDTLGGTYVDIKDGAGAVYSVVVAGGVYVAVDYTKFLGVRYLKVKSGTNEAAARVVKLVGRMF